MASLRNGGAQAPRDGGSPSCQIRPDFASSIRTGSSPVIRYVAMDDCGVVLSHTLLEGQILGGIRQGLGQVLGEVCVYQEDGQLLTASFMDYAMPHADVLRRVTIQDLSVPSPNHPLDVKGAGEAGTTGALATAMNAVLDALRPAGVLGLDMPASAQRVWQALQRNDGGVHAEA